MAHPKEVKQTAKDLREKHGYTIKAVAEELGIPIDTVKRWLTAGVQRRDRLRAEDPAYRAKAAARARQQWQEQRANPVEKEKKYAYNRKYYHEKYREVMAEPERAARERARDKARWEAIKADPEKLEAYRARRRDYKRRKRATLLAYHNLESRSQCENLS